MNVALIVWFAALVIAYSVAGSSLELILLASKVLIAGAVLGVIGQKLCDVIRDVQFVKARASSFSKR